MTDSLDMERTPEGMNRTEYAYDLMDRVKTKAEVFKNANGIWVNFVSKAYKYDGNGNAIKELDGQGYASGLGATPDEKINNGYGTVKTYDLMNRQLTELDPVSKDKGLGYAVKAEYDGAGRKISEINAKGIVTKYTYDDAGNLLKTTVNEKTLETKIYCWDGNVKTSTDGNGNTTSFEYNSTGKLRQTTYPGDSSIPTKYVVYQYDRALNLIYSRDDSQGVDLYKYDSQGRQLSVSRQSGVAGDGITVKTGYDANGNKRFETDGNGNTRENRYDELGRLVRQSYTVTDTQNTKINKIKINSYDANGNLTGETTLSGTDAFLAASGFKGNTVTNVYDPINRLVEKYDPNGNLIQKLEYNYDHMQVKAYDYYGNVTEFYYDKDKRPTVTRDPEGHTVKQSYDNTGNICQKVDGNLNKTDYTYNELNKLVCVTDAKGQKTSFTYDLNGNLLTQQDGKGNTTIYEYNAANKVSKKVYPGGRTGKPGSYSYDPAKTESYTYYSDGSMKLKTDRNGVETSYIYDIYRRLVSKAAGDITVTYTYDNNGNQLTMTDSTGTTIRVYDEENRVKSKTVPNFGTAYYQYDIKDPAKPSKVKEITTDPKGNTVTKTYDELGRVLEVSANGNAPAVYSYDFNGNVKTIGYPNGTSEVYEYTRDNLLKVLTNKNSTGGTMDQYTYTYDAAHNQVSKEEVINGASPKTTSYTYDYLNRLESVTEPGDTVTTYSYDAAGNRLSQTVKTTSSIKVTKYLYDEQNRLLSTEEKAGVGQKTLAVYQYDNNGNLLSVSKEITKPATGQQAKFGMYIEGQGTAGTGVGSVITRYEYDAFNRMISSFNGNGAVTYAYNGDGLRVEKCSGGKVTRYMYEYDRVVLEVDAEGIQLAFNVRGAAQNLISRTVSGQTYYYMYNGHGDVTALVDISGAVQASYYYDAFGNQISSTGVVDNPYRYSGYMYDTESKNYYLNARYYDPGTARFLTEDTVTGNPSDPLSLNLYTYCHNEPIMYDDSTGHYDWAKGNTLTKGSDLVDDVKELQDMLIYLNYLAPTYKKNGINKLSKDGDFGDRTADAVMRFKKKYGLGSGSDVGKTTWAYLEYLYDFKKLSKSGIRNSKIGDELSEIKSTFRTRMKALFSKTYKTIPYPVLNQGTGKTLEDLYKLDTKKMEHKPIQISIEGNTIKIKVFAAFTGDASKIFPGSGILLMAK